MARERREPADHVTCRHCRTKFRAITGSHLRNIHGYAGNHPINDYKREFSLPTASCRETRQKIRAAKDTFWAKRGQHWTRATLLAEIHRVHRAGRSLRCGSVPVRVYEAGRRLFGRWATAVETAGLNYEQVSGVRRWTRAKVVARIRELAGQGVPLHATYIEQQFPYLYRAAVDQFLSSWAKALRAAGFDPAEHKMSPGRWDEPMAGFWVRERVAAGESILARDTPHDLLRFVHTRLRMGWAVFVESLGVHYPGSRSGGTGRNGRSSRSSDGGGRRGTRCTTGRSRSGTRPCFSRPRSTSEPGTAPGPRPAFELPAFRSSDNDLESRPGGIVPMATFITNMHFTEQGIKAVRDTCKRAAAFKVAAEKMGVKVSGAYWTLGAFDGVMVCEAPDEATVTAALLHLAASGNIRTQTVRAFDAVEMQKLLGLLPK